MSKELKKPSLQKLIEISEALGVTVNAFIYDISEPYVIFENSGLFDIISERTPNSQKSTA